MAGVVSGDAGPGLFAGEVIDWSITGTTEHVVALYHINVGGTREFTARLNVTQDDLKGTAVLTGEVTKGWMKHAKVTGTYQVIKSSNIQNSLDGRAFQGTLHLQLDR
jgi:hypothetical protein